MSVAEHKALIHRAVDAFNQGDLSAVDQLFTPDYVDHDPSRAGLPPGPAGVKLAWQGFRAAFPDAQVTVDDSVAEGQTVAVRGTLRGTHHGELMGIPATARPVRVTFIDFNRIANGQMAERWAEADTLGLMQQVGAIPGATGDAHDDCGTEESAIKASAGDPEAHKALARRYADLLLNQHQLERAAEILAPDFVGHFAGAPGPVQGIDAWRAFFGGFLAAFPDYRETVHDVVAEADRVAARISFTGTHQGDFFGLPPTGKAIAAGGMACLRIADGRVVEQWTEADVIGLLQQLGAVPTPQQASG
jgi:steroid delta-isomerase-like uncharacterized protein